MGQEDIARILNRHYPNYMGYLDIAREAHISKRSVMRCLSKLEKRNEVEFKIIEGNKPTSGWKKLYRSKGGN